MQRTKRTAKLLAALLALGLFAAACSSGTDETAPAGDTQSTDDMTMMVGLDEGAPALQATLTDLLDSHVYLASIAVYTGVVNGLDSGEFKAAAATLDQNSVDLSEAIGSVYGPDAEEQFLGLWREHIGFFVDYAAGQATGDEKMAKKAQQQLDAYTADFAAFLESATGLPADAGQDALAMHVASLSGAIDAVVAGDAGAFDKVYEAASMHMPMTAQALAGAIAAQNPEEYPAG
ncbi:MAG: hypothetical protein WEA10_09290 [Actinomycetota bacterium]